MRRASRILAAGAVLVFMVSLALAARSPVAFKTIAALTDEALPALDDHEPIDIARFVRAIPDRGVQGTSDTVYAPHPAERYQRSVVDGYGNCSNLVKGLAWGLLREGYAFEVVHIIPNQRFGRGQGHTVLRARLALPEGPRVGLADIAAAAIPRVDGRVLDIGDLVGAVPTVHLDPLRSESEDWTRYYRADFLGDVAIARTASAETARWFRFLEAIYVDVGLPEKLDKMVYAGIGVVLGVFPRVYVDDLAQLRERHSLQFAQMKAALWGMRIAPLVLLGCGVFWIAERVRGRRRRGKVECRNLARVGS